MEFEKNPAYKNIHHSEIRNDVESLNTWSTTIFGWFGNVYGTIKKYCNYVVAVSC